MIQLKSCSQNCMMQLLEENRLGMRLNRVAVLRRWIVVCCELGKRRGVSIKLWRFLQNITVNVLHNVALCMERLVIH